MKGNYQKGTHLFVARQTKTSDFSELREIALHFLLMETVRDSTKVDSSGFGLDIERHVREPR